LGEDRETVVVGLHVYACVYAYVLREIERMSN
jgi:hypothetical protein